MAGERRSLRSWWPVAAAAGSGIVSSLLAVLLLLNIQARNAEHDQQARAELVRVQQQMQAALCGMVVLMDNAWHETPPSTASGRNLAGAIAEARLKLGCPGR